MDNITGLVYLHNQAGTVLMQANVEIQRLREQVQALLEENADLAAKADAAAEPKSEAKPTRSKARPRPASN